MAEKGKGSGREEGHGPGGVLVSVSPGPAGPTTVPDGGTTTPEEPEQPDGGEKGNGSE